MSCKYPTQRTYNSCLKCSSKNYCEDAFVTYISMPEVQPPKNVIPSASEANKMTNHVIFDDTQLEDIGKEIRRAIADGKFSISEERYLKPEIRKKLEELGYKVETGNHYHKLYYTVSWKEVE